MGMCLAPMSICSDLGVYLIAVTIGASRGGGMRALTVWERPSGAQHECPDSTFSQIKRMLLRDTPEGGVAHLACGCHVRRLSDGANGFVRIEVLTPCAADAGYAGTTRSVSGLSALRDELAAALDEKFDRVEDREYDEDDDSKLPSLQDVLR